MKGCISMMDKLEAIKTFILDKTQYVINGAQWIIDNKGVSIFLPVILLVFITDIWIKWLSIGMGLYGMILLKEWLNHKIEKDKLDSIDLHFFESSDTDLEGPLDAYVDMCINEYMLLNRGYKTQQAYINSKEESLMHKEILDLLASNMSELMKKKFEMYYGKGRVESLIARKSYIKVSLYVANNNKVLYEDKNSSNSQDIDQIFRAMMINDQNNNQDLK